MSDDTLLRAGETVNAWLHRHLEACGVAVPPPGQEREAMAMLLDCLSAQICDGIVVASVARGLRKAFSALRRQLEIGALHAAAGEGRRED